jgi:hypothetical protein
MDFLKSFYQLFKVVPSDGLFQPPCLRENDKEVSLVGWEHEVGAFISLELHIANVIA